MSNTKIFDSNNNLLPNFEDTVTNILIDIHGEHYYDIDEDYTQKIDIPIKIEEKTIEDAKGIIDINSKEIEKSIKIKKAKLNKITFKDFVPLIFFVLLTLILVFGGLYFADKINISDLIK